MNIPQNINPKIDHAVDLLDEAELVIDRLKVTEDVKHERHEYGNERSFGERHTTKLSQRMRDLLESDTRLSCHRE